MGNLLRIALLTCVVSLPIQVSGQDFIEDSANEADAVGNTGGSFNGAGNGPAKLPTPTKVAKENAESAQKDSLGKADKNLADAAQNNETAGRYTDASKSVEAARQSVLQKEQSALSQLPPEQRQEFQNRYRQQAMTEPKAYQEALKKLNKEQRDAMRIRTKGELIERGPIFSKKLKELAGQRKKEAVRDLWEAKKSQENANILGGFSDTLGQRINDIATFSSPDAPASGQAVPQGSAFNYSAGADENIELAEAATGFEPTSLFESEPSNPFGSGSNLTADRQVVPAGLDAALAKKELETVETKEPTILDTLLGDIEQKLEGRKMLQAIEEKYGAEGVAKVLDERPDLIASLSKDEIKAIGAARSEKELMQELAQVNSPELRQALQSAGISLPHAIGSTGNEAGVGAGIDLLALGESATDAEAANASRAPASLSQAIKEKAYYISEAELEMILRKDPDMTLFKRAKVKLHSFSKEAVMTATPEESAPSVEEFAMSASKAGGFHSEISPL